MADRQLVSARQEMEKLDKKKEELVQEKKDTQTAVLLFCAFFFLNF